MNIGILGGSFNPIHIGHCILASYIRQNSLEIDEVWMNISPQNPLKQEIDTDYDRHRVQMVKLATDGRTGLKICDIEFSLPKPSYTIRTLDELSEQYPEHRFSLIIGSDNWFCFDKWKESERIIEEYGVIVYPRPGYPLEKFSESKNVTFVNAPQIDISSTMIRQSIKHGMSLDFFLPDKVLDYIKKNKLYTE